MTTNPQLKWVRALLGGVALLLLLARAVVAEEPTDLQDLHKRLEVLEKQNQDLLKVLKTSTQPDAAAADGPPKEPGKELLGDKPKLPAEPKREAGDWFEIGKQLDMKARWDNGMWFLETADRAFRIHVGGRTQFDVVWLDPDNLNLQFAPGGIGPVKDGVNFRRARLEVDGTLYDQIDFWCEYDFLNTFNDDPFTPASLPTVANTPVPTDLWVTFTRLPIVGNIRIGNQKPPISFEHMTSSRFLNFLERSYAFDAFVELQGNGFRPGITAFNWLADERATWAAGIFSPQRNIFGWNQGSDEIELVGRVTALPIYRNDGRCLVHLALGASWTKPDEDIQRFRARTLLRNGPPTLQPILAETRVATESQVLVVPELAVVWGPFSMVAEYYASWQANSSNGFLPPEDRVNVGTTFYHGGYVELLYFLTGEHRLYNRRAYENRRIASFDRVIPNENFFFVEREDGGVGLGRGAWQVGARYAYIDLQNKGIGVGIAHDVTLGLNWFWNANSKFQINYSAEHRQVALPSRANGWIQGVGTRVAFDF